MKPINPLSRLKYSFMEIVLFSISAFHVESELVITGVISKSYLLRQTDPTMTKKSTSMKKFYRDSKIGDEKQKISLPFSRYIVYIPTCSLSLLLDVPDFCT